MTYTREEWEPAATKAAEVSKQAFLDSEDAITWTQAVSIHQKTFEDALIKSYIEIAELREKLATRDSFIANQTHAVKLDHELFEELREKLEASELELSDIERERDITITHLQQERDRLRKALEEIQDLDRCVSTFQCRKVAFKALAQPEVKA